MSLRVGEAISMFRLIDQFGKYRNNKEFLGKSLVLFFEPIDDTPVCTMEVCGFRD